MSEEISPYGEILGQLASAVDQGFNSMALMHPHFRGVPTETVLRGILFQEDWRDDDGQLYRSLDLCTRGMADSEMFCVLYDLALTIRVLNKWTADLAAIKEMRGNEQEVSRGDDDSGGSGATGKRSGDPF